MEELKIVKLFIYVESNINGTMYINGRQVKKNRYVYEEVTKVIPADRIKVLGRYESNGYQKKGYPELPMTYRLLRFRDPNPTYYTIPVSESNRYLYSAN